MSGQIRVAAASALAEQQLQFQAEKQKKARANVMERVSSRQSSVGLRQASSHNNAEYRNQLGQLHP